MKKLLTLLVFISSTTTYANVIGSDAQNFAPTQDGIDFVTVHASETLDVGVVNVGVFLNYAVNTFPAFEGSGAVPAQSLLDRNDSLTSADFNFAIGLFENFQFGMSFPYVLDQTIEDEDNVGQFTGSGTVEIRPAIKYKFHETENWGFATSASANFNRIENNPYLGDDAGPTFNLEFIADRTFGKWNWAVNFGHRWRDEGEPFANVGIDPLPDQWIYSTALSYLIDDLDMKLIGEIYGSAPTEDTDNLSNRQNSSMEALFGVKYDINRNLASHFGVGTQLGEGTSTPDYRIYGGLNYAFGPIIKKQGNIVQTKVEKKIKLRVINLEFEFGTDKLTPASELIADELVAKVRDLGKVKGILVEGHTDSVGSQEYNQGLSERRANTIKRILVERVPMKAGIVEAVGLGEEEPIADNGNYQGRQKNRRVEIHVDN